MAFTVEVGREETVQEVTSHSGCSVKEIRKQVFVVHRYYSSFSLSQDATEKFLFANFKGLKVHAALHLRNKTVKMFSLCVALFCNL